MRSSRFNIPFDCSDFPYLSKKGLRFENLPINVALQRASGDKADEIMEDFPNWKAEDIDACLAKAAIPARRTNHSN